MRHTVSREANERYSNQSGERELDELGREIPDPTPMQPPVGYKRAPTLAEQIRAMVRSEKLRQEVEAAGAESFEEADDFEVGDDFEQERTSPYEANFDPISENEIAALTTAGRDPDRILTKAEKAALSQKPKKQGSGDQPDSVIGSDSDDPKPAGTAGQK